MLDIFVAAMDHIDASVLLQVRRPLRTGEVKARSAAWERGYLAHGHWVDARNGPALTGILALCLP